MYVSLTSEELNKEKWKHLVGSKYHLYQSYYVSNYGRVKNSKGHIMALYKSKTNGYIEISLSNGSNHLTTSVHRLVALAFVDNPNHYDYVNHKDENKSNNRASNLEWCTQKYNVNYGTAIQRASETYIKSTTVKRKIPIIVTDTNTGKSITYTSIRQTSRAINVNRATISNSLIAPDAYGDIVGGRYQVKYATNKRQHTKNMEHLHKLGKNSAVHKKSSDELYQIITKKFPNLKVLDIDKQGGNKATITLQCKSCNNVFTTNYKNLQHYTYGCPKCAIQQRANNRAYSKQAVQDKLNKMFDGNLVLQDDFVQSSKKCTIYCNTCHNTFKVTPTNIMCKSTGNGCPFCNRKIACLKRNRDKNTGKFI